VKKSLKNEERLSELDGSPKTVAQVGRTALLVTQHKKETVQQYSTVQ
jgi:hypothetical protein